MPKKRSILFLPDAKIVAKFSDMVQKKNESIRKNKNLTLS